MGFFLFGKKKRTVRKTLKKKPSAKILRTCKKLKIKTTKKVGSKRVYKSVTILKKLIKRKMRKMKKVRKVRTKTVKRYSRFGRAGEFENPANYGYNQPVVQKQGILDQTSQVVTSSNNASRPSGLGLAGEFIPTYGVARPFFTADVPTQVGPQWNFMGQPDGTAYPVGGPFVRYTKPAFGKKARRSNRSACAGLGKKRCESSAMCKYTKVRKCHRRPVKKTDPGFNMTAGDDEDLSAYAEAAGITFFGRRRKTVRRRRYNVAGSSCNKLRSRTCKSNPNCTYTKRGCRRRSGTASRGVVYEGPALQFGRRRKTVRRRRYNVAGSSCNRLKKRVCQSSPNCTYTKRGCRRRSGTASRGVVYEGPALQFGRIRF